MVWSSICTVSICLHQFFTNNEKEREKFSVAADARKKIPRTSWRWWLIWSAPTVWRSFKVGFFLGMRLQTIFSWPSMVDDLAVWVYCIHSKWVNQGNKNLGTFYLLRKGGFEAEYGFQNLAFFCCQVLIQFPLAATDFNIDFRRKTASTINTSTFFFKKW